MTDEEIKVDKNSVVESLDPIILEDLDGVINVDDELDINPKSFKIKEAQNNISKQLDESITEMKLRNQHNKWIDGFAKGSQFFKWIERLGYLLLCLIGVISIMAFWVVFAVVDKSFIDLSILMLRITQLGFGMLILALLLKWICAMLSDYLYDKELKALFKEGGKYVNK